MSIEKLQLPRHELLSLFASAFTSLNRTLELKGSGPFEQSTLLPLKLTGQESLSRCYAYELECLSSDPQLAPNSLLGSFWTVGIVTDGHARRSINGIVTQAQKLGSDGAFTRFLLRLEPCFALLAKTRGARIWQEKTIPQIVESLLQEKIQQNPLFAKHFRIENQCLNTYSPRAYRAMYQESELQFIERSLAEEGVSYLWGFDGETHILQLCDEPWFQSQKFDPEPVHFHSDMASGESIYRWQAHQGYEVQQSSLAAHHAIPDSVHYKSAQSLLPPIDAPNVFGLGLEAYEPQSESFLESESGLYKHSLDLQKARDLQIKTFHGSSNIRTLYAGLRINLKDHPDFPLHEKKQTFLLLNLSLEVINNLPEGLKLNAAFSSESKDLKNSFICVSSNQAILPSVKQTKPAVHGLQSATVVGPQKEELFTDVHGRIRIQFPWQRPADHPEGGAQMDEKSSAWVRVMQGSAGPGWGMQFIPRVGHEVLVAHMDGDPDRPVVVGSVYNGSNDCPRFSGQAELPGDKALSGIQSKEFGSRRKSELIFDDTPGQLRTRLATEHAHTELNLGYLTHPRSKGQAQARGEGAELRSDKAVSIRGAKGLLLSAAQQVKAGGPQLDRNELLDLVKASKELLDSLAGYAAKHQALQPDMSGVQGLEDKLKDWETGHNTKENTQHPPKGQQIIALSAPDGLLAASPESVHLYAGENLDLSAQQHSHFTVGQQFGLNAGKGISLFAHSAGFKAIAHQDDALIHAQKGNIDITASQNVQIIASENEVLIMAKKKITLLAGDAYITLGDGKIELGCTGSLTGKSAKVDWQGPASMEKDLPKVEMGKTKGQFKLHFEDSDQVIPNRPYRITLSDGKVVEGISDEQGLTAIVEDELLKIMHIDIGTPQE